MQCDVCCCLLYVVSHVACNDSWLLCVVSVGRCRSVLAACCMLSVCGNMSFVACVLSVVCIVCDCLLLLLCWSLCVACCVLGGWRLAIC